VGAYIGTWTDFFKQVFPDCHVLMIEAQETKRDALRAVCDRFDGSVAYRIALLGSTSGRCVRFVEMETGSSVFEEKSAYERTVTQRVTSTLDQLLESDPRPVDLIKLDVQGYELEVLRGARGTLRRTHSALLEASLIPVNEGVPLIAEVILFMDDFGFRLIDLCDQNRRWDGSLWQTDLLFVHCDSGLLPDSRLTRENWG
jgi:FkbM family methyltransferase